MPIFAVVSKKFGAKIVFIIFILNLFYKFSTGFTYFVSLPVNLAEHWQDLNISKLKYLPIMCTDNRNMQFGVCQLH